MAEEKEILIKIDVQANQLADVQQLIKETNKEFAKGEKDVKEYTAEIRALKAEEAKLKEEGKQLLLQQKAQENSIEGMRAKLSLLTKQRNQLNLSEKDGVKRAAELNVQIKELNDNLSGFERAGGDFRRNVGNYPEQFKEAAGGIQVFGHSLGDLFKLILTNPIGLILTALTGLYQALKQNDTIATFFKGVMTGLGVVFDNVAGFISKVVLGLADFLTSGSALGNFFSDFGKRIANAVLAPLQLVIDSANSFGKLANGDFKGALLSAGSAMLDFGKNITFANNESNKLISSLGELTQAGIEYEKALDDIEAKQSKLNVTISELEKQRARLILQSKDLSKTEEERIRLNEAAAAIDKRILSERLSLLNEEISAQQKYINALDAGSVKREEAEFRLNDLLVQRNAFEQESIRFQELAQNKRNAIIEKQQKLEEEVAKKREEEERKRQEELEKRNQREIEAAYELEVFKREMDIESTNNLDEQLEKRRELLEFQKEFELSNTDLVESERLLIIEKYKKKEADLVKQVETQKAKVTKQKQKDTLDTVASTTQNVLSILNQQSAAYKALQIADATRNAYLSFSQTMADPSIFPTYLKPILAGVNLAVGLANVAKLAGVFGGGGEFETNGPTMIMVGDNPGGRERVTVEPISGRGQTRVFDGNKIAMAGGGVVVANGASRPIKQGFEAQNNLLQALSSMPPPEVSVKEITDTSNRVRTKERISRIG
jgi:hypothetical protein